jgi:general secretion pathway protein H
VGSLSVAAVITRRARRTGFTLVEILVVVAVIAIVATLVVADVGGGGTADLVREARRLAGALEHAQALAQWQSETLGVSADDRGYRFWRKDDADNWVAFSGDDVLAPRTLAAGMRVTVQTYGGAPVTPDAILPFRASGRNEPFTFAIGSAAGAVVVAGDPIGRVSIADVTPGAGMPAPAR